MPHIVLFEDNRAASFLRHGLYAEVIACVEAAEQRMGPLGNLSEGELILTARLLISKAAALVHLRNYPESGLAALRSSRAIWLFGIRRENQATRQPAPRNERLNAMFESLFQAIQALKAVATDRAEITQWLKTAPDDAELKPRAVSILQSMAICEPVAVETVICLLQKIANEDIEGDCIGPEFMNYLAPDSLSTRTHKRSKYVP